jgi:hypothetical protein
VKYVVDALYVGWANAAAEHFARFVSEQTLHEVMSGEPRRRCHLLAKLAKRILKLKKKLHKATGDIAARLSKLLGRSNIEGMFAAELAERIPQPWDTKLDNLARALRMTGVLRCVAEGLDLNDCECLTDLIKAEGAEQTKQLLLSVAQPSESRPS